MEASEQVLRFLLGKHSFFSASLITTRYASCLCWGEIIIIGDSSGRAHESDLSSLAQTDKELFFYYLLGNGRIFIHFGQPLIFLLLEWLEVPSYPY